MVATGGLVNPDGIDALDYKNERLLKRCSKYRLKIRELEAENERLRRALTIIEDRHHPDSEWCDEAKEVLK
jgi:hypothetical protein